MASDAAGYHAAHETYTGEGTQSLLVTDTIDDASTSVFWNNNDDTKQIIHGSSLTELLTSGASKNASWGGFQTFSIDPETDCIGDLYLSITLNLDTPDTPLDSDLNPKTVTTMLQKPSPRDAINDPSKLEPIGWYKRGIKNGDTLPEAGYIGIPNGWLHLKTDANDLSSGFRYAGTGMDAVDSYGLPIDAIELPGITGIHPDSSPRAQAWEDIQDVLKKDAELFKVNDFICTDTYLDPSDNQRVIHQRDKDVGIGEYLIQDQGRTATNSYDVNSDYIRSVDRARSFRILETFYHNGRRNNFTDEYNVPTETDDNTWTLSTLFNDEKLLDITTISLGGAFLNEHYASETLQISAIFPSSVTLADIQANEASYISRLLTTMSRTVDQFVYPEWTGSITSTIVNIPERHWGWYVFDKYVTDTLEFFKAEALERGYGYAGGTYIDRSGRWVPTSTLSFDNPLNPDIIATLTLTADPDEQLAQTFWLSGREGTSALDRSYANYLIATMSCHKMEEPFLNWPGNVSEFRNNISSGSTSLKTGVPSLNNRDDYDLRYTSERMDSMPVTELLYQTRSSWENYPGFTSYPGQKLLTCTKKSSLDAFGQTVDFLVFDFFKPHSMSAANLGPPRDITPEEMNKYISSTRSILTGINNEHLRTLSTISTHDGFRDQNRRGGDIEYTDSNFQFGRAMAISGDGTTIVIGAPAESLATTEEGTIEVWRWQNEYILDSVPMYDNAEPWRYATGTKHWVKQQSSMSGDGKFRGQFPGDMYGSSVAINADGSKIVVGCPGAQGANGEADGGQVQVLVRNGWVYNVGGHEFDVAKWGAGTMLGEGVQIYGGGTGDRMGGEKSLAINASGNTIAVGSALSDRNGADSGSVFVYEFIPPVWTQRTVIDGEAAGDRASFVAMDTTGDIVAVGAPYHVGSIVVEEGVNIGAGGGQVRVWYWDRTQSPEIWVQRGSDIESTSSSHSQVGRSVAMNSDGDIVAFGGYKNIQGSVTGFVRIVKWTETLGTWEQMGSDIEGEEPGDNSGHSVSLSATGDTVSIGAPQNSIQGAPTGHVRVWSWNGNEGTWLKRGSDISGVGPGENFGHSVSLNSDGNMVAVGAPEAGSSEGCVRVYTSFNAQSTVTTGNLDKHRVFWDITSPSGNNKLVIEKFLETSRRKGIGYAIGGGANNDYSLGENDIYFDVQRDLFTAVRYPMSAYGTNSMEIWMDVSSPWPPSPYTGDYKVFGYERGQRDTTVDMKGRLEVLIPNSIYKYSEVLSKAPEWAENFKKSLMLYSIYMNFDQVFNKDVIFAGARYPDGTYDTYLGDPGDPVEVKAAAFEASGIVENIRIGFDIGFGALEDGTIEDLTKGVMEIALELVHPSHSLSTIKNKKGHDNIISPTLIPYNEHPIINPYSYSYLPKYLTYTDSEKIRITGGEYIALKDGKYCVYRSPGRKFSLLSPGNYLYDISEEEEPVLVDDLFISYLTKENVNKLVSYYNGFDDTLKSALGSTGTIADNATRPFSTGISWNDGDNLTYVQKIEPVEDPPRRPDNLVFYQSDYNGYCTAISSDGNTYAVSQGRMYGDEWEATRLTKETPEYLSAKQVWRDALEELAAANSRHIERSAEWRSIGEATGDWSHPTNLEPILAEIAAAKGLADVAEAAFSMEGAKYGVPGRVRRPGLVRVYKKKNGSWVLNKIFRTPNSKLTSNPRGHIWGVSDGYNSHVKLSGNGNRIVIGAAGGDNNSFSTYDYNISSETWTKVDEVHAGLPQTDVSSTAPIPKLFWATNSTDNGLILPHDYIFGSEFGSTLSLSEDGNRIALYYVAWEVWDTFTVDTPIADLEIGPHCVKIYDWLQDSDGVFRWIEDTSVIPEPILNKGYEYPDADGQQPDASFLLHEDRMGRPPLRQVTNQLPIGTQPYRGRRPEHKMSGSLALSGDGNTYIVGNPNNVGGKGVYVYRKSGNTWNRVCSKPASTYSQTWPGQAVNYSEGISSDLMRAYGKSVAINYDGTRFASTYIRYDTGTSEVSIYDKLPDVTEEVGVYVPSTDTGFIQRRGGDIKSTINKSQLGSSVAISGDGNRMVIGVPASSLAPTEGGYIKVFKWDPYSDAWVEEQQRAEYDGAVSLFNGFRAPLNISGAESEGYGSSVAISRDGKTIIVGNPGWSDARGRFHLYHLNNVNEWTGEPWGDHGDIGERLGDRGSLAINSSGNTIAISSSLSSTAAYGGQNGRVIVWYKDPGFWWRQRTEIVGEAAGDRASVIAMDSTGDIVAVGAPYNDSESLDGGHLRVWYWDRSLPNLLYTNEPPGVWVQLGSDIVVPSVGGSAVGQVGRSVAMNSDGDIVAFGGYKNIQGSVTGFVRIVKWTETLGTWEQMGSDIEGEEPGDNSGHSVSLSATGVTVSIGAPQNSIQGAPTGHVRIWDLCEGTWLKRGSDISGVGPGENFGNSVALSSDGNMVAVGAPEAGSSEGCVRVYTSPGIPITQSVYAEEFTVSQTLVGDANDYMGYSLSFNRDGTKLVTGAPRGYNDASPVKKTRTRDPTAESAVLWTMGSNIAYSGAFHHLPVNGLEGKSRPEYLIHTTSINSPEESKEASMYYLESFGGHFHDTYDGAIPGWQDFGSDAGRGQRSRRLRMASGCVYLYELNMSTSPGYTAALWSRTLELDVDSGERNPTDQKSWPGATGKYGQCQGTADCLGVSVAMDGMGNTIIAGAPFMSTIGKVQEKIDWYPGGGMTAAYSIHAEGETTVIEDGDPVSSVLLADTTLRSHIRETEEEVGRSYVFNLDTYIYGTPSEQLPIKDPTAKNMLKVDAYNMVNDAQRRLNHDITDFIDLPEPGQPIKWDKQFTSVPIGANYPPLRGDYQAPEWADSDLTSKVKFPLLNVIKKIEILVDEKVWQTINHSDLLAIYSTEMTESSYKTIATNSSGRLRNDGTRQANTGGRWIPGKKYDLTIPIPGFTSGVSPRFNNFTKNDENGFLAGLTDSSNFKVRVYYNDLQNVWNTNNVSAMQGYRAPIYNVPHETVKIEDGIDSSGNNSSLVSRGARYSVTGTSSGTGLYVTNVPEPWTPGITFDTKMYGQKIIMNRDELKQLKNTPGGITKKIIKSQNANNVFNRVLYNKPINIELDYISMYSSHLIINLKYTNPYNSPCLKTAQLFLNSKPFAKIDQGLMRGISNKSLGLYANEYNMDNISLDPSGGNYVFPLANKAFGGSSIQFSSFDTIRLELIFESAELTDNNGLLADIVDINVTVRGLSKITYKNGVSSISD